MEMPLERTLNSIIKLQICFHKQGISTVFTSLLSQNAVLQPSALSTSSIHVTVSRWHFIEEFTLDIIQWKTVISNSTE